MTKVLYYPMFCHNCGLVYAMPDEEISFCVFCGTNLKPLYADQIKVQFFEKQTGIELPSQRKENQPGGEAAEPQPGAHGNLSGPGTPVANHLHGQPTTPADAPLSFARTDSEVRSAKRAAKLLDKIYLWICVNMHPNRAIAPTIQWNELRSMFLELAKELKHL